MRILYFQFGSKFKPGVECSLIKSGSRKTILNLRGLKVITNRMIKQFAAMEVAKVIATAVVTGGLASWLCNKDMELEAKGEEGKKRGVDAIDQKEVLAVLAKRLKAALE